MAHSSPDTRLRSSCDRCHELKNRCARVGGPDSRCERCDRLDIDCVYSSSVRMGRPPGQKPNSTNPNNNIKDRDRHDNRPQPRAPRRQARARARDSQPPLPSPDTPSSGVGTVNASSSSQHIATQAPSATTSTANDPEHLPTSSVLSPPIDFDSHFWLDAGAADAMDLPLDYRGLAGRKPSVIDGRLHRTDGADSLILSPDEQMVTNFPAQETPFLFKDVGGLVAASINSAMPGPAVISSTGNNGFDSTAARLLNLQARLRNLVAADHDSGQTPGDETVLTAAKDLWDITQGFLELGRPQPLDCLSVAPSRTAAATSSSSSESLRFAYPAFKDTSTATCQSTILQLVTCYAYLVQMLEPVVSRLAGEMQDHSTPPSLGSSQMPTPPSLTGSSSAASAGTYTIPSHESAFVAHLNSGSGSGSGASTPSFSLGSFSLAAEPSLNAEMVLHVLFRILRKTHTNIDWLAFEEDPDNDKGQQQQTLASSLLDTPTSSPIMMSARAVMAVVYKKETHLVQRMKELLSCI